MFKRCFHVGNKLFRIDNAGNLDGGSQHRGVREVFAQNFFRDAACVDGADAALVVTQLLADFSRCLGGVDDNCTLRVETLEHVNGFNQALVYDNDIVRIINVGMYGAAGVADAVVRSDRCAHALRTVLRKTLYIFARAECGICEQETGGFCALSAAAVPADLDNIFHV